MSKETWFSVFDHKIQVIIMLQIKSLRAENCGLSQGLLQEVVGVVAPPTHQVRDDDLLLVSDAKHIIRVKGKGLHKKCPENGEDECMEKPRVICFLVVSRHQNKNFCAHYLMGLTAHTAYLATFTISC
jgi:hypothetical protein